MLKRFDFENSSDLARQLASAVAKDLMADIEQRGRAALAVSGGSTPKMFFQALADIEQVDWEKVIITLVDERWVEASSMRSNARLVKENLMRGQVARARFLPLYSGGKEPDKKAVAKTNALLDAQLPLPFSAVILGMGNDGHTASFFPDADTLDKALSEAGPALAIRAPGAGEARITLTLPTLLQTRSLYLHIQGAQKHQTLERALGGEKIEQMPVRAVLFQKQKPLLAYWCP